MSSLPSPHDTSPAAVPADAGAISRGWLQAALRRDFPGIQVLALRSTRIGADYGMAGEVHRLALDAEAGPAAVVVKLWSADSPAGLREAWFYGHFGAAADPFVPRCHHARGDAAAGRGVLVLQDLSEHVQGDCLDTITLPRAVRLAEALATLHVRWWRHDVSRQPDALPHAPAADRGAAWHAERRRLFLQRYPDALDPAAQQLLGHIEEKVERARARLLRARPTLLHRDLHLDNVLFDRSSGDPVILDWATAAVGAPALDLAAVAFELADLHDTDAFVAAYRAQRQRLDGMAVDVQSLQAQLGAALLLRFAGATCGVARWQPPAARGAAIVAAGFARAARAVRHWQARDPELFAPRARPPRRAPTPPPNESPD